MQEQSPVMDVLIIEDEAMDAMVLQELLEELGHRVLGIACTRQEAVALTKAKSPSLVMGTVILADGPSGIAAVDEILQFRRVPVVFVTGFAEDEVKARRREPTFLVRKPCSLEMLAARIRDALRYEAGRIET